MASPRGRKTWRLAPLAEDGSLAVYANGHDRDEGFTWQAYFAPTDEEQADPPWTEGERERRWRTVTMREPEPFTGELRVIGFQRGRSAARLIWTTKTGAILPMFMVDIVATLQDVDLIDGWTESRDWEIVKRGANFGIRLLPKVEES